MQDTSQLIWVHQKSKTIRFRQHGLRHNRIRTKRQRSLLVASGELRPLSHTLKESYHQLWDTQADILKTPHTKMSAPTKQAMQKLCR